MDFANFYRGRRPAMRAGLPMLMRAALGINGVALVVAAVVLVNGWSHAEWLVRRGAITYQQLEILAQTSAAIERYLELIERGQTLRPDGAESATQRVPYPAIPPTTPPARRR